MGQGRLVPPSSRHPDLPSKQEAAKGGKGGGCGGLESYLRVPGLSAFCCERSSHLSPSLSSTARPRLSSSSCRLCPAPVPREFPEKQGCQQRQNQAGRFRVVRLSPALQQDTSLPVEVHCLWNLSSVEDFLRGRGKNVAVSAGKNAGCVLLCYSLTFG